MESFGAEKLLGMGPFRDKKNFWWMESFGTEKLLGRGSLETEKLLGMESFETEKLLGRLGNHLGQKNFW